MNLYSAKVQCFGCGKAVDKSQTFTSNNASKELRYQCPGCFKNKKVDIFGTAGETPALKKEFFCGRCKFKFRSKSTLCPYCSKEDQVIGQVHSVKGLL